jgi:hypothetical protein
MVSCLAQKKGLTMAFQRVNDWVSRIVGGLLLGVGDGA